ncbi:MAG: hypothetical protein JKY54_01665 [Flavobacteriales bacterium]|nr:hypothetical protein [Flavobacteriales bacterium]
MKRQVINYPKEKADLIKDYFDGEERRELTQNGEVILWFEMSKEKLEKLLELKFEYTAIKSEIIKNNQLLKLT